MQEAGYRHLYRNGTKVLDFHHQYHYDEMDVPKGSKSPLPVWTRTVEEKMNTPLQMRLGRKALYAAILLSLVFSLCSAGGSPAAHAQEAKTPEPNSEYFTIITTTLDDGRSIDEYRINGPPTSPPGYEVERAEVAPPEPNPEGGVNILSDVPAFDWSFGCSATSGAMIAGYYDRTGFPNIYTGPTNSGVIPLDSSSWPKWTDGNGDKYGQNPLAASHNGLDGRPTTTRGSIDDYWVKYKGGIPDPFITNFWPQHTWGDAIGDYMKTSQSGYGQDDGLTSFYNYAPPDEATPLTCSKMEEFNISQKDGTYGRKLFYEAKGYSVTDCYSQITDNKIIGGFSFAQYKAEIDAGRPVFLNLEGHSIVGVGYNDTGNTVYIHDTWDYLTHSMTWGGSYSGMSLLSVSMVNIPSSDHPVPTTTGLSPSSATAGGAAFTLTVNGTNFVNGSTVRWNGSDRTTAYVSSTQLTASIPAADIATGGTASVTVFTGTPGGGTSNAQTFTIVATIFLPLIMR